MKRITRIIRPIICMVVLLFAMTTAVMGCYQKETEPIDIPDRTPSGTSAPQPSATPAGEVIPSVDRQAELAEARAKNPDTVAWLYIPGAEVDDPVMQAEDNGYYLKLDENGEYAMWGCYYAHCENEIGGRDKLDKNTTIFGHSASNCDPDGVRFTKLYRYMDADFVKENPYIYLSVDGDDLIFQITALFITDIEFDYIFTKKLTFDKLLNSIIMQSIKICVVGLGYVGLPLARLFSTKYPTVGFDMNQKRVDTLMAGHDTTLEVPDDQLQNAIKNYGFKCTTNLDDLCDCNFYIVAVPTPVDENNRPDLRPLWDASATVGKVISRGDIVVYESTVYPGVTEEECLPVVERISGLKFNVDFFAGYSPERINPGDKEHTVEKIKKVTSGSTSEVADIVDRIYNSVLVNGTHKAPSIRVAEASKIIENSQRDVNIAFMNELSKIFNAMGIDTNDVIEAASSKWNFIKLKPGLVGGHCISVDPYYLIQKAQIYGVLPRIIFAARRLNDGMGAYVAEQTIKCMNRKGVMVKDAKMLILGITFKENCPDVRNTKIVDIYHSLIEYTQNITIFDPWANPAQVKHKYDINIVNELKTKEKYDAIILGVAHKQFLELDVKSLVKEGGVIYDVKGVLPRDIIDSRL